MKLNKKYITIIFYSLLFINSSIFASDGICTIDSSPPEELRTYLNDSIKITSNIQKLVKKEKKGSKISTIGSELLRGYNSIISFNNYIDEFQFFILEPIFNEIPYQITRDDKLMAREIKRLDRIHYNFAKRGYYNIKLYKNSDICKGISNPDNCILIENEGKGKKAGDIIIDLIDNTRKIRTLMQNSSMGKGDSINLLIVDDDFPGIIYKAYSEAKEGCSLKEGGFLNKINEKIHEISLNTRYAKKGIKDWKSAWDLLLGVKKDGLDNYENIEKKLLKKELSRQGLNSSQTDAIMKNLKDFNSGGGGYDYSSNPISNSFEGITNSISDSFDEFTDSIGKHFSSNSTKGTSIASLQGVKSTIEDQNKIEKAIEIKYKQKLPLTATQDLNTSRIITQLINMHTNIGLSINILDETCPISEIVCKSQGTNLGGLCDCQN